MKAKTLLTSLLAMVCTHAYATMTQVSCLSSGMDDVDTLAATADCSRGAPVCYRSDGSYHKIYAVYSCNCGSAQTAYTHTAITEGMVLRNYTTCGCSAGYYVNGAACTECPALGGIKGTSTGSTGITGCYIPKGNYSDTRGKYAMTENCYSGDATQSSSSSVA